MPTSTITRILGCSVKWEGTDPGNDQEFQLLHGGEWHLNQTHILHTLRNRYASSYEELPLDFPINGDP
ncbi:MAG: hypothetical protein NPIRA06_07750 [Nitrospirales bacterium]|nr:MAG: hypothetical protein NPIRA06_07750 [Nitrospirales bacterium]